MPALLYARISKLDTKTPKVDIQLQTLRKLAAKRGLEVAGEYVDDGLSAAKAENRPDWDRLMADLPKFPGAVILATEEARLARNATEKAGLLVTCRAVGATWETVRDGVVDPATASGALMSSIRGAIDAFESDRRVERWKDSAVSRRERGIPQVPSRRAFGFEPDGWTLRQPEADLVRTAIRTLIETGTLWPIVKGWNRSDIRTVNGKEWTYANVQNCLSRWRNCGWTEYQGQPIVPWSPERPTIATREEIEAVRAILADAGRNTDRKFEPVALCSGIAKCICGAPMVAADMNGKPGYRCSARVRGWAKEGVHTSIRREQLDPMAASSVVAAYWLMEPSKAESSDPDTKALTQLHKRLETARRAVKQVQADREAGIYTQAEAASAVAKHRAIVDECESKLAEIARANAHAALLMETSMLLAEPAVNAPGDARARLKAVRERWEGLSLSDQRRLLAARFSIVVGPGRGTDRVDIRTLDGKPAHVLIGEQ